MKKQTFIISLLDNDGRTVNFERWAYKKLKTCVEKMVILYRDLYGFRFVKDELNRTKKLVAHKTDYDTNENNKVWEIGIDEFIEMIEN